MSSDEQDAFDRELALMASETSMRATATGKAPKLDVGLPLAKRSVEDDGRAAQSGGNSMVFTLITKKGSKSQVRVHAIFVLDGCS
jgi:hypothetical protein